MEFIARGPVWPECLTLSDGEEWRNSQIGRGLVSNGEDNFILNGFGAVQSSSSVVSDSLRPHGLQHVRPPCPSPIPRVYSNACPSSQWRHPTISPSVVPFSSCLQSFPASGSFQMSQFFTPDDQSIGISASASVLPMNTQDWSPCSPKDSQESSPTPQFKIINSSALSFLYSPTLTSMTTGKKP